MLPTRSLRLLDCCFEGIKYDISHGTIQSPVPNLTRNERRAIRSLKNKDICITRADKGDITVIMCNNQLVQLAHVHLSDKKTYTLLIQDPTMEVVKRFNQYLMECRDRKSITEEQFKKLYLPGDTGTQTMYFLPKLHKTPLKLRPIISCTNGPTYTASALLDKLLQPHMKATKSYIKNSTDLIHILNRTKVPKDAFLITLDIESLYTNISHDEAILSFLSHPRMQNSGPIFRI